MTGKLYRSRSDRMIAGVCGGLAEHFGWDPVLVRLVAVALLFATNGGAGIVYLVMAAIVPEEPAETAATVGEAAPPAGDAPDVSGEPAHPDHEGPSAEGPAVEPAAAPAVPLQAPERRPRRGAVWLGSALVLVGLALLVDRVFDIDVWRFWPALLIYAGVRMIVRGVRS